MGFQHRKWVKNTLAGSVALACTGSAFALEFETDGGWRGSLNTTVSASASWRAEAPHKDLIWQEHANHLGILNAPSTPQPGWAGTLTDDGNLNWDKGDRYQTLYKFVSELSLAKGDTGALIRVKGWYDQSLNDDNVRWGNGNTGYGNHSSRIGRKLSDADFNALARFDGLYLLDAYAYTSFDLGDNPVQVRLGRQAVNWGESLFVAGLNQLSPLDIIALRKAGTEIKEALLPVWSAYGNLGLPGGMSLEAYYQLKWEPSEVDSCGTFWGATDILISTAANNCSNTTLASPGQTDFPAGGTNLPKIQGIKGRDGKDSGQWGLALRMPVEAIDTEFGLYYMNINARLPVISGVYGGGVGPGSPGALAGAAAGAAAFPGQLTATFAPTLAAALGAQAALAAGATAAFGGAFATGGAAAAGPACVTSLATRGVPVASAVAACTAAGTALNARLGAIGQGAAVGTALNLTKSYWECPSDIQIVGISAATNIMGWSTGWELSYQKDVPVQYNGTDLVGLVALGRGPLTPLVANAKSGDRLDGYARFDKTQFQVNGVYLLPSFLGNTSGQLVAEAAAQWNNVPASNGTAGQYRYGRAFVFGSGGTDALANCLGIDAGGTNRHPDGCKNQGYVDDFAWGYRVRMSLDYAGIFDSAWTATPTVFFLHDVDGYSMDGQFTKDRQVLSMGVKFSLNKVHNIEANYTTYSNKATFDPFRDRDNYSLTYSYTF